VAARAQQEFSLDGLREVLAGADIEGKEYVLGALAENFASYVVNVDEPPGVALVSPRLS
jgi:hypothetical protein